MQQVTLNIAPEKMPLLSQFLKAIGIETSESKFFASNEKNRNSKLNKAAFHPYYDWEFFRNELEYE